MNKKNTITEKLYIFIPGIITALVLSVVYLIDGFFPFGKGSVAALDLNTQYLPLLYRFYDLVTGRAGMSLDFHLGGGLNLFSESLTELLNPFNYVLLLFERQKLYLGVNILIILYGFASSVTASYALKKISPKHGYLNIVLSLCYGMSFYNAYQFEIIRWMYLVVLFPLFVLSIRRLLVKEKVLPFSLLIAYQMILGFQIGIQLCFFTLVLGIFYILYLRKSEQNIAIGRKCLILGLGTIAGILISAIGTYPYVMNIFSSARATEGTGILNVVTRHGLEDVTERLLEVINPVVLGCGVVMLVSNRKLLKEMPKEYKYVGGFLLFMLLTVLLQPANLLWHLGSYQCFPVRYGYMVLLMTILAVAKLGERYELPTVKNRLLGAGKYAVVLPLTIFIYAINNRLMFSMAFSTLAISSLCKKETILFILFMLIFFVAAVLSALSNQKIRKVVLPLCAGILGAVMYLCILFPATFQARSESEEAYARMGAEYELFKEDIMDRETGYSVLGHMCESESKLLNEPLVSGKYSMTAYMPTGAELSYVSAIDNLGYITPWVSVRSEGGTAVSDILLGIHNPYLEEVTNNQTGLYNGVLMSKEAFSAMRNIGNISSMETQMALTQALCYDLGLDADRILKVYKMLDMPDGEVEISEDSILYICPNDTVSYVYVDGQLMAEADVNHSQNPRAIRCLGRVDAGKYVITATDYTATEVSTDDFEVAVLNLENFGELYNALVADNSQTLLIDNRKGTLKVENLSKDGILLLPFAYHEGFLPKYCEVSSYFGGFLRLEAQQGAAEVLVYYHNEYMGLGLIISLLGVLILILIICGQRYTSLPDKCQKPARVVFATVSVLFVLAVYILPAIGLMGYLAGKVTGLGDVFSRGKSGTKNEAVSKAVEPVLLESTLYDDGIQVVMAGENLVIANKARMSADSYENKDFKADKAGDGNTDETRWSSENNRDECNHYLQADLRSVEKVRALRIFWSMTNACKYEILVSCDDKNMEDTDKVRQVASFEVSPSKNEQIIFLPEAVDARYVRLKVSDVNRNEEDLSLYYQNISVSELEIYGEDCESFLIEKPVLSEGVQREVPVPKVPAGYELLIGGVDYENLLTDEGTFIDTYSAVPINLGYILKKGDKQFDMPGFDLVLPGSEEVGAADDAVGAADGAVGDAAVGLAGNGFFLTDYPVREWKQTAGEYTVPTDGFSNVIKNIDASFFDSLGEEGYEINIEKDRIELKASTEEGVVWGGLLLSKIEESGLATIPCGIIRDYPKYSVRGFTIDVARRPLDIDFLKKLVDELSDKKMNTLQIHLNDNAILSESEFDGTTEGARKLYSAFRMESDIMGDNGEALTAADLSYSKKDFYDLTEYALTKGVKIVPEIDTPAHSMAITKILPSLGYDNEPGLADTLNPSKRETLELAERIWSEYLPDNSDTSSPVSAFEKCDTIHLGMDEFFGDSDDYEEYLVNLYDGVHDMAPDKNIRIWGSFSVMNTDLNRISRDIELMIWNPVWADPQLMYDEGFKIINCLNSNLYIIVGGGTDHLNVDDLNNNWEPNRFMDGQLDITIPSWSERMLGASYSMWNDNYTKGIDNTSEDDLLERFKEPLDVISSRLW